MIRTGILQTAAATALLAGVLGCSEATAPGGAGYPLLEPPGATLTEEQRRIYEEDAVRLAIRHLVATRSPQRNAVEPPLPLVSSLYAALVAVHASSHPARDTVIDVFHIRAFPNPPVYEIMVAVDPAASWTQAWRRSEALTGNAAIDEMVVKYGISVVQYYHWPTDQVAVLRTSRPINTAALAAQFARVAGVRYAEPNGYMGDGNDIRVSIVNGRWHLAYSVGFGDCPAGCIGRRTWTFSVNSSGDVGYLGVTGPPPGS
jgi:hypothetical protein